MFKIIKKINGIGFMAIILIMREKLKHRVKCDQKGKNILLHPFFPHPILVAFSSRLAHRRIPNQKVTDILFGKTNMYFPLEISSSLEKNKLLIEYGTADFL